MTTKTQVNMIKVSVRYAPAPGTLFDTPETIGFWDWNQFVLYFNRIANWDVWFQIESISGGDYSSGRKRADEALEACTYPACRDHLTSTKLFHWGSPTNGRSKQSDEEFIDIINDTIRNRHEF